MKLIDDIELAQLLIDKAELLALEEAGVDNWIGYGFAHSDECDNGGYYLGLLETPVKEIVKYYKDA